MRLGCRGRADESGACGCGIAETGYGRQQREASDHGRDTLVVVVVAVVVVGGGGGGGRLDSDGMGGAAAAGGGVEQQVSSGSSKYALSAEWRKGGRVLLSAVESSECEGVRE